ncbi:antibiotic biosynthesis monooxygenase [Burkholderia sp. Bp9143]|uniref:putative quinol monooxygenase n=1 Tax=Burkholderia sp. Bp9143 TaxID=2184574 RepID=UPI000F5A6472|nr:antibiotic biosynthesis monooxygenase [Burkholderia sp. Bp9143]RQR32378.1 antibiotic biosynthesis monooxygenase [Burkholderia sp. Bp9143]
MIKYAILATIEARPGKEEAVAEFLKGARTIVQDESHTINWYAFRTGKSTFAIFDTFNDEAGRDGHLNGAAAQRLMAATEELFVRPPIIEKADLVAYTTPK